MSNHNSSVNIASSDSQTLDLSLKKKYSPKHQNVRAREHTIQNIFQNANFAIPDRNYTANGVYRYHNAKRSKKCDGKSKKFACTLPQIAVKRKDKRKSGPKSPEQVVLLDATWDTSSKTPNLIAEMHNVDMEELQLLKSCYNTVSFSGTGLGGKSPRLNDSSLMDISAGGTPSPLGSDSGIEDSADGNLSWLLNYKINELPPVPEQQIQTVPIQSLQLQVPSTSSAAIKHQHHQQDKAVLFDPNVEYHAIDLHGNVIELPNSKTFTQDGYLCGGTVLNKYNGPKKPPFTYTELIEHALVEKGELTVSGIYQWISDHFPFYKQNDDRWKNSVRHNLSINPHFRKGTKAVHGAGHLWTIAQRDDHKAWQIKRQRMEQFINSTPAPDFSSEKMQQIEIATATASILPSEAEYIFSGSQKRMQPQKVAVEYVIDMSGGLGDFLCPPVSKEQVVEECGLGSDYLITDLNPSSLGLNIGDAEIITGGNLYDDLNFQTYELQAE